MLEVYGRLFQANHMKQENFHKWIKDAENNSDLSNLLILIAQGRIKEIKELSLRKNFFTIKAY